MCCINKLLFATIEATAVNNNNNITLSSSFNSLGTRHETYITYVYGLNEEKTCDCFIITRKKKKMIYSVIIIITVLLQYKLW